MFKRSRALISDSLKTDVRLFFPPRLSTDGFVHHCYVTEQRFCLRLIHFYDANCEVKSVCLDFSLILL